VSASERRLKLGWSTQIEAEQIRYYGDLVLGWMREKVIWIAVVLNGGFCLRWMSCKVSSPAMVVLSHRFTIILINKIKRCQLLDMQSTCCKSGNGWMLHLALSCQAYDAVPWRYL
jgi:hypothetical protein